MLTELGESGVDAFTIVRIAGHSSVLVSKEYLLSEATERTFKCLQHDSYLEAEVRRKSLKGL